MPGTLTSPYQNNAATPAQNTVVGFKISKPGYDARRTAGNNFIFNSSWPSLPIAYEITITNPITSVNSPVATIPHNLKFPPFTMAWAYGPDESGLTGNAGRRIIPVVDANNVYLTASGLSTPPFTATKIKIRCFQLDLSRDMDYVLAPGDTFNMPYDNNFGIKAVKPNKDINSTDLRDFAIHSRAQSPLILAVKTEKTIPNANIGTGIGNVIQYTSKLSYPVWAYGYVKMGSSSASLNGVATGSYRPAPFYAQSYPRTFSDGFLTYLGYGFGGDTGATLVILRDPMFAATPVTVQY
jgi:hypothetical protein